MKEVKKMELIVKTEGELVINENVKEYAESFKNFMSLQVASKMETDEDFSKGAEFIKGLAETQKKIKEAKDNLVNGKAEEVMKILDSLNGEIASKKTEFKKEIDAKKEKIKHDIIVSEQQKYAHACSNSAYKSKIAEECEQAFKGKSSFDNMRKDAEKIGLKYIEQFKQDEKTVSNMNIAYKEVLKQFNESLEDNLIETDIKNTYFEKGKDVDFLKADLFQRLTLKKQKEEAEKKAKEEEEKKRLEEVKEKMQKEGNEKANAGFQSQYVLDENIEEKPQETLDNKEQTVYNSSVEIPKKDTYFKVKFKEVGEHTQIIIFAGVDKDHLAKGGQIALRNQEFEDFKALFPANEYQDLNKGEF